MGEPPAGAVVVAIGGSGRTAVLWAAEEARRTSRPLHLLHVARLPADDAFAAASRAAAAASAETALDGVRRSGAAAAGRGAAETPLSAGVLEDGWTTGAVLAHLGEAFLLVLERGTGTDVPPMAVHDAAVLTGTAVVTVPTCWTPGRCTSTTVVAAVRDPADTAGAAAVVRAGLLVARARAAALVVLHAWSTPTSATTRTGPHPLPHARHELEELLRRLRPELSEVEVEIHLRRSRADVAVLAAADVCNVLVLGPPRRASAQAHLGAAARAAHDHPTCPVLTCPGPGAPELHEGDRWHRQPTAP